MTKKRHGESSPIKSYTECMEDIHREVLGWVGEASHCWRPRDGTSVTSGVAPLKEEAPSGPAMPQSFPQVLQHPQAADLTRDTTGGEMFLTVEPDISLCQNTLCSGFLLTYGLRFTLAREWWLLYLIPTLIFVSSASQELRFSSRSSGWMPKGSRRNTL